MMAWGKKPISVRGLASALAGAAFLLSPTVAWGAEENQVPTGEDPFISSLMRRVEESWMQRRTQVQRGDREGAALRAKEITELLRDEAIGRVEPMAEAAVLEALREERAGHQEAAAESFRLARALDPQQPSAWWGEARALWRSGRSGAAISAGFTALRCRWGSFWRFYGDLVRLGLTAFLALLVAGMAALLVLLTVHGPRLVHSVEEHLPDSWHSAWRRAIGFLVLLSPLLLQVLGLFVFLPWAVALLPAAERKERRLIRTWLVLAALAVPVSGVIWVLAGVISSPAARVGIAAAEKSVRADLVAELNALAEAHPEDPTWKVLQARFLAPRHPDQALRLLRVAAEQAPGDARVKILLGNVFFRSGKPETSGVLYREALNIEPANFVALFNLARSRQVQMDFAGAEEALNRARQLSAKGVKRLESELTNDQVADPIWGIREVASQVMASEALPGIRRVVGVNNPATLAALAALLAGGLVTLRFRQIESRRCQRCGEAFCGRCVGEDRAAETCNACQQLFQKKEGLDPAARQAQAHKVDRRLRRLALGRNIAQFLWPGLALIHQGRTGLGFFEAASYAFGWLGFLLADAVLPDNAAVHLVAPGTPYLVLAGALWLLYQLPAFRPGALTRLGDR